MSMVITCTKCGEDHWIDDVCAGTVQPINAVTVNSPNELAQLLGDTVTEDQPFDGQQLTESEKAQLFEDSVPCDLVARDQARLLTECLVDENLPAFVRKQAM